MKTAADFLGMTMLLLLGVIVILGMVIVIAAECRVINRLRQRPEPPPSQLPATGPFLLDPHESYRRRRELS